jgi:hypothetical protein
MKLKSSRYYQNCVQTIGSSAEIILFLGGFFMAKEMFIVAFALLGLRIVSKVAISEFMLGGFFMAKEMFIVAFALLGLRIVSKVAISEFMYKRMSSQIKEGKKGGS